MIFCIDPIAIELEFADPMTESLSKLNKHRPISVVEQVAGWLRESVLAASEGDALGSEDELCTRFRVSKPTLRQAVRLLEYEELIDVRRGVRGGYYARRPRIETVARLGATYLRSNPQSVEQISPVLEALSPLIVHAVIDSDRLHILEKFLIDDFDKEDRDLYDLGSEFIEAINDLTDNFVVDLIHAIFYQFGSTIFGETNRHEIDKTARKDFLARRNELTSALLRRDVDAAIPLLIAYRSRTAEGIRQLATRSGRTAAPAG
jgi:DNA-binding FadR family transcriptional regulator